MEDSCSLVSPTRFIKICLIYVHYYIQFWILKEKFYYTTVANKRLLIKYFFVPCGNCEIKLHNFFLQLLWFQLDKIKKYST